MSGFEPSNVPQERFSEVIGEPVSFASSIQPYGVLLALSSPQQTIVRVSANTQDYFGISPQSLLGRSLNALFDETQIEAIAPVLEDLSRL